MQVVNFIASGAIEHGMLSLLSFKKSLFAGVLDGGQDEVFLGGSRLKRFMESVEKATVSIPQVALTEPESPATTIEEVEKALGTEEIEAKSAAPVASQAWAELASTDLAFLDKLSEALTAGAQSGPLSKTGEKVESPLGIAQTIIEKDETGRTYLKLPAPNADTLKKLADVLYKLSGH